MFCLSKHPCFSVFFLKVFHFICNEIISEVRDLSLWTVYSIGGGKGEARGLNPPLRMISHRNYLSWSGAENRDKDRDTLIK